MIKMQKALVIISLNSMFCWIPSVRAEMGGEACKQKLEKAGFQVARYSKEQREGTPVYMFDAAGEGNHPVWGKGNFAWQIYTDMNCKILKQEPSV
jgi:hypothetical protein